MSSTEITHEHVPYVFFFELNQYDRDSGRFLQRLSNKLEGDAPPNVSEDAWLTHWRERIRQQGREPWDLSLEDLGNGQYLVRASYDVETPRAAEPVQPPAPVINVTIPPIEIPPAQVTVNINDEPVDATVTFRRNPDGSLKSATIVDANQETDNG